MKTLTLALPRWTPHRAGQHYDVRLVAPDGYQAQRSYSIASAPERAGVVELTVERLEEGEVSTYLTDVLVVGDEVEVRGPIGGYFVWDVTMGGPLLLVAGGSGVVPLMAMLRHRRWPEPGRRRGFCTACPARPMSSTARSWTPCRRPTVTSRWLTRLPASGRQGGWGMRDGLTAPCWPR